MNVQVDGNSTKGKRTCPTCKSDPLDGGVMGLTNYEPECFLVFFFKFSGADTKLWSLCDMKVPLCGLYI